MARHGWKLDVSTVQLMYAVASPDSSVTASITFGGSQLILAAATLFHENYVPTAWQTYLVYLGSLIGSLLINLFFNAHLDKLNTLCLYWTAASVIIIIVTLLVMADHRNSAEYAFTHFDASNSGWPNGWAWFVGLLQGAYTLTGYGMVAALCEEVREPAKQVPRAMVLSVAAAAITGITYLLPINFVLPKDITPLLEVASLQPMPLLYKMVTNSSAAAMGLLSLSESQACCQANFSFGYLGFRHNWCFDRRIALHLGFLA